MGPTLRELSSWSVSSIDDEGLFEIVHGCHLLENLDLFQCPRITNKSLLDIAKNCLNLNSLSINDCSYIGNESLKIMGEYCLNLKHVGLKNCPLIGDQGIVDLFYLIGHVLSRVKLMELNINDIFLDIISHYGTAVTHLSLADRQRVEQRGFWVLGNNHRLQKLEALLISAYYGVNNLGLRVICKGCPNLKLICIQKRRVLSDYGLVACVKALVSLQSIQLEECHLITQARLYGILLNCKSNLMAMNLSGCISVTDISVSKLVERHGEPLKSLIVDGCRYVLT
ncbi:hypothetical protein KY290_000537 [Solanum tuberosum]|uniref:F-box/LRR-repeat protein 15-like leucin rich repeat domain-containing protein n=1 Tax=Solanum tuberosum TaxID=4113 RepID=A0ABQ7WJL5_SOLTU|nr:hypothetical protein KY289_000593 [Solanum tuberosum]KAH0780939.1 hypothetical protein KY290_000537 [Solanum tuberosum]